MPFGKWDSHNSCVDDMMSNQGYDEETAHRVCAWLEYEITGSWPSEKDLKKGEKDMPRKNEESFEGYISKIQRELNKKYPNEYIIATFGDAVIVDSMQEVGTTKYYEIPYKINNEEIEFGEHKEVAMGYVEKRIKSGEKVIMSQTELSGPIFKKEEKQRIVYAAVLVPGEPDYDYEKGEKILTAEEIEYVAHKWLEDYGNIDYMHGLNNVAKPVESYILPMDLEIT
ncbi:MAG: XkdF-like putative serine protease domain-containing protein, partial [Petrotogales bacterium]